MKIIYRQSGGIAGVMKGCELDAAQMAPVDRESLLKLVEQAGVQETVTALSEQARDVTLHDIQIEQEGETRRLLVDDLSAPAAVRPLLSFLKKRAKSMPGN
jgi:hypothetical protein